MSRAKPNIGEDSSSLVNTSIPLLLSIKGGRYASVNEAVRAGLRLLEERKIKIVALRHALKDGEESGTAEYSLSGLMKELDNEGSVA